MRRTGDRSNIEEFVVQPAGPIEANGRGCLGDQLAAGIDRAGIAVGDQSRAEGGQLRRDRAARDEPAFQLADLARQGRERIAGDIAQHVGRDQAGSRIVQCRAGQVGDRTRREMQTFIERNPASKYYVRIDVSVLGRVDQAEQLAIGQALLASQVGEDVKLDRRVLVEAGLLTG